MKDKLKNLFNDTTPSQAISYFIEAAILIGLLYEFGQIVNILDTLSLAFIWALASTILAIGFAYPAIIKKKNTKEMFQDGSRSSRYINGRGIRLFISYVLSAFLCATLLVESIKWSSFEWLIVCIAIPAFFIFSLKVSQIAKAEYEQPYQRRGRILYSRIGAGIALTVIFAFMTFFVIPILPFH